MVFYRGYLYRLLEIASYGLTFVTTEWDSRLLLAPPERFGQDWQHMRFERSCSLNTSEHWRGVGEPDPALCDGIGFLLTHT